MSRHHSHRQTTRTTVRRPFRGLSRRCLRGRRRGPDDFAQMAAAQAARARHRHRQPHALPSWCRLARLLQRAFDLKKMVLGLDSKNPLPDKITYDYEFTDLKRAYGHLLDEPATLVGASPGGAPLSVSDGAKVAGVSIVSS